MKIDRKEKNEKEKKGQRKEEKNSTLQLLNYVTLALRVTTRIISNYSITGN